MTKVELKNEEYFTYSQDEKKIVSSGQLTGNYILSKYLKFDAYFLPVICIDTYEVYFIRRIPLS